MAWFDRGVQTLLATVGAFAAFSLMTIAIGTDYWLYSRAYICNSTNATTDETQTQPKTKKGDLTHSGLWRICCIEGNTALARAPKLGRETEQVCCVSFDTLINLIWCVVKRARRIWATTGARGHLSAQRNRRPLHPPLVKTRRSLSSQ